MNATLVKHKKDTLKYKLVLIVDDEKEICQELSQILKESGYRTLSAHNGDQARKIVAQIPVDLVLLDLKLPDVNGLDLIEDIKKTSKNSYIIVMTGYGSLDSAKKALQKDTYDYITKPFTPEKILTIIKKTFASQSI